MIWVHRESAELLGPIRKMLSMRSGASQSPIAGAAPLRAAVSLWISAVFLPCVLEARWLQVGFLWFCSVSETQTPLSCQIPHNTAVLVGRELPAINRGSLALHGEHQALLLTWGTPSTAASLGTPLSCARPHPTAVSAWLGQPDPGFGTQRPAVSPHAGNGGGQGGGKRLGAALGPPGGLHPSCALGLSRCGAAIP